MKSANIDSIKCEFSEYLFDKTEHPDWLPANPSKAGHKGLSIFGACIYTYIYIYIYTVMARKSA